MKSQLYSLSILHQAQAQCLIFIVNLTALEPPKNTSLGLPLRVFLRGLNKSGRSPGCRRHYSVSRGSRPNKKEKLSTCKSSVAKVVALQA